MIEAGFGKVDITPRQPVPLAGYWSLRPRISQGVRDPLFVRAMALRQGPLTVVSVVFDLLLTSEEMVRDLRARLVDTRARVIVSATHTHSAPGGIGQPWVARVALGPYRPGVLESLCTAGEQAARAALGDLAPATWAAHQGRLPNLAGNRRDADRSGDDALWALRLKRARGDGAEAIVCGFAGHPVIVAERDPHRISADFPGEVVRRLETQVDFALFVNGALGGQDVCFPEGVVSADENLALQAEPIAREALEVLTLEPRGDGRLRFASCERDLPRRPDIQMAFDDQRMVRALTWPLGRLLSHLFSRAGLRRWRMQAVAIEDTLILGTPADIGISVARAIRDHAHAQGFRAPFVTSQTDGYVGYVHRRDDYRRRPSRETLGMALYENALGIFGRQMGETMVEVGRSLIDELAFDLRGSISPPAESSDPASTQT